MNMTMTMNETLAAAIPNQMAMEKSWLKVPGHIAPGVIFFCFGTFGLLKTLQLSKELPPGRTFTQVHVPFRDRTIIRNIGVSLTMFMTLGMSYHLSGAELDPNFELHMTLYSFFLMVGMTAIFESQKRLPPESARSALALAFFLAGFLWRAHGLIMMSPMDQIIHVYLGYINFANGFAYAFSVMRNDSIIAHLAAWGLMVVQGIWLFVIAYYLCCYDMPEHMVAAIVCMITVGVTMIVVIAIAVSDLPQIRDAHQSTLEDGRGHYEVLAKLHDGSCHGLSQGSEATGEETQPDDHC